jgi:hypothetical protein
MNRPVSAVKRSTLLICAVDSSKFKLLCSAASIV